MGWTAAQVHQGGEEKDAGYKDTEDSTSFNTAVRLTSITMLYGALRGSTCVPECCSVTE